MDIRDPVDGTLFRANLLTNYADVPWLRPDVTMEAARDTYNALADFAASPRGAAFAGARRAEWAQIAPLVRRFIEARAPELKGDTYTDLRDPLGGTRPQALEHGHAYVMRPRSYVPILDWIWILFQERQENTIPGALHNPDGGANP
jgi:hypothetical protein